MAIAPSMPEGIAPNLGTVYIVGAGPGDPDLLTMKAHRLLAAADVVLFADSLIPPAVLQMVRPEAEVIPTASKTLEEIVALLVDRARSHATIVRLHSGDPCLYSAVYEQMRAIAQAGIPFEVIPGISAFQAAAAHLKTELTVPGLVQTLILTRMSGRTHVPDGEDLAALAAHRASLCLYLSARHVAQAQAQLLQHYPPETPVAICFRLGWDDEQVHVTQLADMAAVTQRHNLTRTTLYVISPALAATDRHDAEKWRSRLYNAEHERLFRDSVSG